MVGSLRNRTAVTNFVLKAKVMQLKPTLQSQATLKTVWETIVINLTKLSCLSRWLPKDWTLIESHTTTSSFGNRIRGK